MTHANVLPDNFDGSPEVDQEHAGMLAAGQKIEDRQVINYFGAPEAKRFFLPDGVQFFEFAPLTEGGKAKYERKTNKDIRVQRSTGDAKMSVDPATERQTLIMLSVVDAEIYGPSRATGTLVKLKFEQPKGAEANEFWQKIFQVFPPKIIQDLYRKIRDENEWMRNEEDPETLREEAKNILERAEALEAEKEKNSSS